MYTIVTLSEHIREKYPEVIIDFNKAKNMRFYDPITDTEYTCRKNGIVHKRTSKALNTPSQWRNFPQIINRKERVPSHCKNDYYITRYKKLFTEYERMCLVVEWIIADRHRYKANEELTKFKRLVS